MTSRTANSGFPEVHEKSCGVIVFRNTDGVREYLLLHYPGGHWDYPKGHVEEFDNSELETAKRELEEETGIDDIKIEEAFHEPMYYSFNRGKKERVVKTVVYFVGETACQSVKISHEHKNHKWLPYERAKKRLTYKNAKEILEKAESHLNSNNNGTR